MVDLLSDLFGDDIGDALRSPYNLGNPDELADLISTAFDSVEVRQHHGLARFDTIDSWVNTDVKGWTLSDMSDEDLRTLLDAAYERLAIFTDEMGHVEFAAPALIATNDRTN